MYCYVEGVREAEMQAQQGIAPQEGAAEKLVHLALPVRLFHMQNGERSTLELACTYDIHPRGARLLSSRDVKVGDFVTVERGRLKSVCQVVWTADPQSALRGQFTVECVQGSRTPWEEELRQLEEQYLPLMTSEHQKRPAMNAFHHGEQNRRRRPRFQVQGGADVAEIGGRSRVEGRLEQISEGGCLISASNLPTPGTALRLVLNMCDVSVALRGHVRYTAADRAMGVEFQEIRQGDRALLDYVLNLLKKPRREDFADLEVITSHLAVSAAAD
jgi:hypothetical protein